MNIDFTLNDKNRVNLLEKIGSLDCVGKLYKVTIRPYKGKRSTEQNNWARGFARDAGEYFGYTADEMYEILMYKHNPIFLTDKTTGEVIRLAGHFSKLDTAKGAICQENMEIWAAQNGFYWEFK